MCETNRGNSDESFITRAYLSISSARKGRHGERMISLTRIGNLEIRMVETSQAAPADAALFWIELFDHTPQTTIDSCRCNDIEEAVAAYEHLVSQANNRD